MDPERRRQLAELVEKGWTLQEIADVFGVSRQRIHQLLRKCPELDAVRRVRKQSRMTFLRRERATKEAVRALLRDPHRGEAWLRFVRLAQRHGWNVELLPRHRVRVEGVPVSLHCPQRLRAASPGGRGGAQYFHVRISRPEWMQVVVFPNGRVKIYLPGELPRAGSHYIPAAAANERMVWPSWDAVREAASRVTNSSLQQAA